MDARTGSLLGRRALVSGSAAGLASTLALALCGRIERRSASAALNGPSQWLWGIAEGRRRRTNVRNTGVGFLIHQAMSVAWATAYEAVSRRDRYSTGPAAHLRNGALLAALAFAVDYGMTPRRLRPGFEHHLRPASMFAVYSAFGLGLAAVSWLRARRCREAGGH
ncbi:MAG: hypothetical protein DIU71_02230 [Proteobacteria bacterium]|nr:MAG: hypothetical protein DIU71_02230 [Pseudomonadota bacterium]